VTLTVSTDPAAILNLIEPMITTDPVRATVLGTIAADLRRGAAPEPWCAFVPATSALVVRSAVTFPALFRRELCGRRRVVH
jgi:hypothetical protein